jgi:hypothetical protein
MKTINSTRSIWAFVILILAMMACNGITTPTPTPAPTATSPAPTTAPQPTPTHAGVSPVDLPSQRLDQADDVNASSMTESRNITSGDTYVQGSYERPFNANTMDTYFPYLDIVNIQGFKDNSWGYLTITVQGTDKGGKLPGEYAAELDVNKNGRGDWLVLASNPSSTSWTTQGVQAWKDTDGDIGGTIAMVADNKPAGGNGYETLVFDQGQGSLPDGAWVRIAPDDPKTVQIAFKLSMIESPSSFAMGAWAGTTIDPSLFDYNDHMTHADAGDPNQGYPLLYPIKALPEIDNTCRLAMGFVPTSNVPGLCQAPQIQHGGAAPPPPPPPVPQGPF